MPTKKIPGPEVTAAWCEQVVLLFKTQLVNKGAERKRPLIKVLPVLTWPHV